MPSILEAVPLSATYDAPCRGNRDPVFTEYMYISMARQPVVGQGFLIVEALQSHSIRHTTLGRTPLDEGSARRRHLYLTTHNTRKRQTSLPPARFEPAIPSSEWQHTAWYSKSKKFYIAFTDASNSQWSLTRTLHFPVGSLLSRFRDHTPHSVGLLWTRDQPDADTSTWQHTPLARDKHPCPRRDSNPQAQQSSGRRPTP